MSSQRILVVDDEPSMCRFLRMALETDELDVRTASSGTQAMQEVAGGFRPDLVLLDLLMPELDGLETLRRLRRSAPASRVVMMSCVTEPRKVAEAMRLGASDYLSKPFRKTELDAVVTQWLHAPVPGGPAGGWSEIQELDDNRSFVAGSAAMRAIRQQVSQFAAVDVPILLLGESGTGKEVLARLIHKLSPRAHRPFLKVNCAALPADLLESELFGYEAGAFTGAVRAKPGKFEQCNKGTILLDEIGEMPAGLQAKLLQVLQDHEFARLGARTTTKVDVRILAATNINVEEAIRAGKFRQDLYYRVNAFTLRLPPLRDRAEEIPLLARHFLHHFAAQYGGRDVSLSPALLAACSRHSWPGNLRELENFIKRYVILGDEQTALAELQEKSDGMEGRPGRRETSSDLKRVARAAKDEAEMLAIARALEESRGIRARAARALNISSKALLYKMRQYGLE